MTQEQKINLTLSQNIIGLSNSSQPAKDSATSATSAGGAAKSAATATLRANSAVPASGGTARTSANNGAQDANETHDKTAQASPASGVTSNAAPADSNTAHPSDVRDVVIIGSGPAGYTAAIYLGRAGYRPLVIAGAVTPGGQLVNTTEVENYPGFPDGVMGPDLMDAMQKQAEKFGAEIVWDDVVSVDFGGNRNADTISEDPTASVEFAKVRGPVKSANPIDSANPTDFANPTDSSSPTDASSPTDSTSPTDTSSPTDSTSPTNSADTGRNTPSNIIKTITCDQGDVFHARAVLVTTGAAVRKLGVPGEREYSGRGVSYCATCDGFFFRGKPIVVVGGGDSAFTDAEFLTRFGSSVTLIHRREEFRASKILVDRAYANEKMKFLLDSVVDEVHGDENGITSLTVRNVRTGELSTVEANGVFIAIGQTPTTEFLGGQLELDANGCIKVDGASTRTSVPGVFAAGDVVDDVYRQAVSAAGVGCRAALDAQQYLDNLN